MQSATVLHFCSTSWRFDTKRLDEHLKDRGGPTLQYLFIEEDFFSLGSPFSPELSQYFQIPDYMLCKAYQRSNGFFSFEESFDEDGHLQSCNTWFRLLIKISARDGNSGYIWHEMTFCSRWTPNHCAILCIGTPLSFQNLLQETLSRIWSRIPSCEPYSLHVPIIEAVITLQDSSVWSVRDSVRSAEKDRLLPTRGFEYFLLLHEAARHAIHSFEVLSVSIETLQAMQQQMIGLSNEKKHKSRETPKASYQIHVHTNSQIRMLRNLLLRAQSNKERLQNEIALAYNLIAQRDSQVMTGIGKAASIDSGAMRTISVVTMAFLPPTFIAAIFSMSFFDPSPGQDNNAAGWSVSSKFWIYWVFAIPMTCVTMGIWYWRQKRAGTGEGIVR